MIKISITVHLINLTVLHVALCMSILCYSSLVSEAQWFCVPYLHDDFNQPETDAEYCPLPSHREGGIATV